jgi:hypothetical protein
MVSPARALRRYSNQRHSDPTAESHSAGRHFGAAMALPLDGPLGPTDPSGSGLMSLTPPWPHRPGCAARWLERQRSARCPRQIDVSRKTGVLASLAELEIGVGPGTPRSGTGGRRGSWPIDRLPGSVESKALDQSRIALAPRMHASRPVPSPPPWGLAAPRCIACSPKCVLAVTR